MDRLRCVGRRGDAIRTEASGARAPPQEAVEGAAPLLAVVGAEVEFAMTKDPRVSVCSALKTSGALFDVYC
jgi:hypothetical protein